MKFQHVAISLALLVTSVSARPMIGGGNDSCATATALGSGTQSFVMQSSVSLSGGSIDLDWYRVTVPPWNELAVSLQPTTVTTTPNGLLDRVNLDLYRDCTLSLLDSVASTPYQTTFPTPLVVRAVNANSTPTDFVFRAFVYADGSQSGAQATVSYDLTVSLGPPSPSADIYCPVTTNSLGLVGRLDDQGSTSISSNNLTLTASNLPASTPLLLSYGTQQGGFLSVGSSWGVSCVTGNVVRLSVATSNSTGSWSVTPSLAALTALGAIAPGESLFFQVRYRDVPLNPFATSLTSNFTNARRVTFAP